MCILTKIIIIIIINLLYLIMYDTHTLKGYLGQRGFLGFGNIHSSSSDWRALFP